PSDRQRLGGILGRRLADCVWHLSRGLRPLGGAADGRRVDGAFRRCGRSGPVAGGGGDLPWLRPLRPTLCRLSRSPVSTYRTYSLGISMTSEGQLSAPC